MKERFGNSEEPISERMSEILRKGDSIPPAPDCRSAVMARISGRAEGRPVWAYACAFGLVAVAVFLGARAFAPQSGPPAKQMAKASRAEPRQAAPSPRTVTLPQRERIAGNPTPAQRAVPESSYVPARRHSLPEKPIRRHRRTIPAPVRQPIIAQTPKPTRIPVPAANTNRPVAIAVVTWPAGDTQTPDNYNYGYIDRNATTGQTTKCSVTRSGDRVDIYLESEPEANKPPVKGSLNYETKPSA